MTSNQNDSSLLAVLRKLYARIMMQHMSTHASAHRELPGTVDTQEIMSTLSVCIDQLATRPTISVQGMATSQQEMTHAAVNDHESSFPVPNSGVGAGELSAYFRNAHKHSTLPLGTGEKLIQTTWEHIDAAIRAAHQMDVKTARLHVDLANSAFKEAAHYLPAPQYVHFSQDVKNVLQEINNPRNP